MAAGYNPNRTHEQTQLHMSASGSPSGLVPRLPAAANARLSADQDEIAQRLRQQSVTEMNRLREEYKAYTDDLLEWAQAQENLDVYQMNAFYARTHDLNYYWRNYWKTICVQFIQTAGLLILLYYDWTNLLHTELTGETIEDVAEEYERGFCDMHGHITLKLLAFFLISFLTMRLSDQIASISEYGMYSWTDSILEPHFIHWGWIAYGLIVNYITLVGSCFISAEVVYLSETPLDMILNFVALYFIIELDDEMVTWQNYEDIEDWIKGVEEGKGDDSASDLGAGLKSEAPYETWLYQVATTDTDEDGMIEDNKCCACCRGSRSAFIRCGMCTMQKTHKCRDPQMARKLMWPLIIGLPGYVLICY